MPALIDELRLRRSALRDQLDQLITRAATDERDLTGDELADHQQRAAELREVDDRIDACATPRSVSCAPRSRPVLPPPAARF